MLSDDRLARRAIKGDRRAFAAIYRRYHQSLYRFCLAIVGNSEDAQDAFQNTMVKVLRALPGEKRQIELKPWLYRIAHNESIELLRCRRGTEQLDPELAAQGSGLAEEAALRERLRRLLSDLDELPERQRGALVMRELAGLDFAEIGAAFGTSSAVARQALYEARLSLRQMDAGREMSCATVTRALSDADGRITRRRDIRAHLRTCPSCRRFRDEMGARRHDLIALSPLPATAAAGLLHGLLGHVGSGGGGLAGALGGGAAKSLGASTMIKSAATVAVVAAVGISAADRGGLIHLGLPTDGGSQTTRVQRPADTGRAMQPTGAYVSGPKVGSADARATIRREVGTAHATKAAAKEAGARTGKANAEATSTLTARGSAPDHQHGRGHEKELPSASAHGQQTAATHKASNHGGGQAHSHPAHPSKPPHPVHHSNSGSGKAPPPFPPTHGAGHEAQSKRGAAPQSAKPAEASPSPETGKQP